MVNCSHCNQQVKEGDEEFVQCDSCRIVFHVTKKCCIMSSTEARVFTLQKRMLIFFCDECTISFKQVPQLLRKISVLEDEIKSLKDEVKLLKSNSGSVLNAESLYNEIHERSRKSKNVLIHNLQECNHSDHKKRIAHDVEKAAEIINLLEVNTAADMKVYRLGRPGNKPRPLKVTLCSEENVLTCLRNKRKIATSHPNIRISADLTVMQRDHIKQLHKELDDRKSKGETNISIRYINGIPRIMNSYNRSNGIHQKNV